MIRKLSPVAANVSRNTSQIPHRSHRIFVAASSGSGRPLCRREDLEQTARTRFENDKH